MAFFGWFIHYVLIFAIMTVFALLGFFAGRKASERKAAKTADSDSRQ